MSACVVGLLSACAASPASSIGVDRDARENGQGTISLFGGRSVLHGEDEFPVGNETALGGSLRVIGDQSTVGIEMGYFHKAGSRNDRTIPGTGTVDFLSHTDEWFIGLWAPFEIARSFHPYVGAGYDHLSIRAREESGGVSSSERDLGGGAYAHAGLMFDLTRNLQLGVDLRGVLGNELNLFGQKSYADYTQLTFTIAYTF